MRVGYFGKNSSANNTPPMTPGGDVGVAPRMELIKCTGMEGKVEERQAEAGEIQ